MALGFLDDDNEWDLVIADSAVYGMQIQMRDTFVILLVYYLISIGGQWVNIFCIG
jgi:hypothetical protein